MPAKTIYVRDDAGDLWKRAEAYAQEQGTSLSEWLTTLMGRQFDLPSGKSPQPEVQAPHGKKTITATVHFWTNNIAKDKGKILPKHAWASGAVFIDTNKAHGTTPMDPLPFNSMAELPFAVERAMVKAGIILHMYGRMKKYLR